MAQQGTEILKQILGVCVQINKKMDGGSKSDKGSGPLSGMFGGKGDTKKAKESSDVIKEIFKSITDFSKTKVNTKKLDATTKALKGLFDVVINVGKEKSNIKTAITLFDSLTTMLVPLAKAAKAFGTLLMSFGAAILLIAGSIWLAGKMLNTNPLGVITLIATVMLGFVGIFWLLSKSTKSVKDGVDVGQNMGKALVFISGGMLAFVISLQLISSMMKTGNDAKGILVGAATMVGVIVGMAGIFALMGLVGGLIKKGTAVAVSMGIGMAALALGAFALVSVAKMMTGAFSKGDDVNKKGDKKGKFGQMMSNVGPGLGVMGIVLISSALLFAGLGLLSAVIIPGVITAILMAGGMVLLALATKKVLDVSAEIGDPDKARVTIKGMVEGAMGGLLDGVTSVLSGGKKGIKGFAEGIKNTVILMNGIALLMGVSVALSMFAKALTAFADLDNMRVIKGYDEQTGEPEFGETVNIRGVGDTIRDTLVSFLVGESGDGGLLGATEGLRKSHGAALRKMGRALTGRRGILSAVIQFADVLKTFAQFGPNGEIGFVEMIPDGVDEDGEAKFKQKASTVLITDVVNNISTSFSQFVTDMAAMAQDFEFGGKEKRKMQRLSTALSGKKGILNPIIEFSQALEAYSKMGEKAEIIRTDAEGKPILKANGEPETIPIADIAVNAAKAVTAFANSLNTEMDNISKRDARQTGNKLEKFEKMIATISTLGEHVEGINKSADALTNLATSISALVSSMDKLDPEKLNSVAKIAQSNAKLGSKLDRKETRTESRAERRSDDRDDKAADTKTKEKTKEDTKASSSPSTSTSTVVTEKQKEQDYDKLGQVVGQAVSAAFKNGQFTFEFATDKSGVLNFG